MGPPRVSLVTLNHNGRDLLTPFFESVHAQTWPVDDLELILVDNGSSDDSVAVVERAYSRVKVIRNDRNEGFARANNQAAEVATGRYLALLNNDMRLEPDWVERMVARIEETPADVVCVGSLIASWDGTRVDFGGGSIAFNGIGYQAHAGAPLADLPADAYPDEIPFACGGAMLVDREVFLEAGGFDEDFFAYVEDVDFGWRLWLLGYRVVFCRDALVYHHHNATSNLFEGHRKAVLVERNSLYTIVKNYEDESLARVLAPSVLLVLKRAALRSGISRDEFSFVRRVGPARLPPEWSRWKGLRAVLRYYGVLGTARKLLARIAGRRARPPAPAPAPRPAPPSIALEAYAGVVAIEELIDALPHLLQKRRRVQSARRRSDAQLLRVFGQPFQPPPLPPMVRDEYEQAQRVVLDALGVRGYFEAAASVAERERLAASAPGAETGMPR